MKAKLILLLLLFACPALAQNQGPEDTGATASGSVPATNPIAPSREIDWSTTNPGVVGGIPSRSTVCSSLTSSASAATINAAIAACPANQVVSLAAGTYNLTSGLVFNQKNNVTLRGAGGYSTFLNFTGNVSCRGLTAAICAEGDGNYSGSPVNSANWTAGYSVGTTSITLSSTNHLAIGSLLILDQTDDSSDPGSTYVCQSTACSQEGPGGAGRSGRGQQQIVTVTGISGSTVSFTPGLYMPNWSSSHSPGAWWATTNVSGDGIENLSINNASSGASAGIMLMNSTNCWIKGVRSLNGNRNHVWLYLSAHDEVIGSYFYGTQGGASQSYGIELFQTSDVLVENNILQHIVAPTIENGANAGDVVAYNYAIDDYYPTSPSWMMGMSWLHGIADHSLYEGNIGAALEPDDIHGTHNFVTAYRNYYIGWETGKSQQTSAMLVYAFGRYFNFLGNVLGKSGYHAHYQDLAPSGTNANTSVYTIGWSGNQGTTYGGVPNDVLTANTMFRWGNYDVVNAAVQWNSGEVPSGIPLYSNPVPSTHTLPTSLFLSSQPSWWATPWGTPPWPAIGPDVTGGSGPGGYAYSNAAELCYSNTATTGGILNFNAATCYPSL